MIFKPFANRSTSTLVCLGQWVGSVEDPVFAKQNDRDSAACPLTDITSKLLKQGLNVPLPEGCCLRDGRKSDLRCAGGSALFHRYTVPWYQTQFPGNGLLDTDNACHHLAAVSGGAKKNKWGRHRSVAMLISPRHVIWSVLQFVLRLPENLITFSPQLRDIQESSFINRLVIY